MEDSIQLLKNFKIKFSYNVNDFLKCAICKNVLIDACVSPCACKFCSDCIRNYLKNGGRFCPGGKDECRQTFLNTTVELEKDNVTNKQISFLVVECPYEHCGNCFQLRLLPEHIRTCIKAVPFKSVGHSGVSENDGLCNMVNEMKQRMGRYESALDALTAQNAFLRQISENNGATIGQMKEEIRLLSLHEGTLIRENAVLKSELLADRQKSAVLKNELYADRQKSAALKNELQALQQKCAALKDELQADRQKSAALKNELQALQQKYATLKDELQADRQKSAALKNELQALQQICASEILTLKKEIQIQSSKAENDLRKQIEERKDTDSVKLVKEDALSEIKKLSTKVEPTSFLWRIEGVSSKLNKWEFSSPFLSDGTDGYKLCLYYCMDSCDGLWLTFILMRGDNDERLQWPMNRAVVIEIYDEKCGIPVLSRRVCRATVTKRKYVSTAAYDRPISEKNDYDDGFVYCMTYEQIKSAPGAIRNDAMTVRCRVLPE